MRLGTDPDVRTTGRVAGSVACPIDEQEVTHGEVGKSDPLVSLPDASIRADPQEGAADVGRLFRVALVVLDPGGCLAAVSVPSARFMDSIRQVTPLWMRSLTSSVT